MALISVGIALLLSRFHWEFSDILAQVIAWGWAGIITLITPSYAARTIVQERLQGTWDAVILSRLYPSEIILGKLLASLFQFWLLGFFLLPSCMLLAFTGTNAGNSFSPLHFVLLAYAAGLVGSFTAASFALYFSIRCATTTAALLWSYLPLFIMGWTIHILGLAAIPIMLAGFNGLERKIREG
jgi:ABC-type Na+ efflux pump permease subunit